MKKIFTTLLATFLLFGMAACSANDTDEGEGLDNEAQTEDLITQSELAELEEGRTIIEEIDDLADLDIHIQSDDTNRRMILFKDEDVNMYRSVYVKRNQHFKIINLEDNHLLIFEGTIN